MSTTSYGSSLIEIVVDPADGDSPCSLSLGTQSRTKFAYGLLNGFEGLTRAFLYPTMEFVLFSLIILEIVVGEAGPLLFELALDDVPIAFDL